MEAPGENSLERKLLLARTAKETLRPLIGILTPDFASSPPGCGLVTYCGHTVSYFSFPASLTFLPESASAVATTVPSLSQSVQSLLWGLKGAN